MKKMLILFVAVTLVSITTMVAVAQSKGPEKIKMTAKMGDIDFDHAKHQGLVPDCVTCHHTGLDSGSCKSCHGAKPEAPALKTVFHQLCKDCHKEQSGPTKCKECHVK